MKGWVYVISNEAMPSLVKVGFSTKDPELRASELSHTGTPHPYIVEYEILVEEPREIEQRVHRILSEIREGREWFRCTPEFAVATIRETVGAGAITESFKHADRLKVAEEQRRQEEQRRVEAHWLEQEHQIRLSYQHKLEEAFPDRPTVLYVLGTFCLTVITLQSFLTEPFELLFWSVIIALFGGKAAKKWHRKEQQSSDSYRSLLRQQNDDLLNVRKVVVLCPRCGQKLRILHQAALQVRCPKCQHSFTHRS